MESFLLFKCHSIMMETELDFYLLAHTDRNKFVIIDASSYIEPPETPIFSVQLPGFKKPISFPFIPNSVNIINTSLLGLSTLGEFNEFADGVYKFTYSICPNDQQQKTRYYLIDSILKQTYGDKLSQLIDNCDTNKETGLSKIDMVDTLIQAAHIQAERGNPITASDWYNRANHLLSKIKINC